MDEKPVETNAEETKPKSKARQKQRVTKECVFCAERIKLIAKRCPNCSEVQPPLKWGEREEEKISSKFKRSLYRIEWYAEWLSYTLNRSAIIDIATRASIIAAIVLFLLSIPGQIEQRQNDAWQVVFLSSQTGGGEATVNALEQLNKGPLGLHEGVFGLLRGASFSGINLSGVTLIGADLSKAD